MRFANVKGRASILVDDRVVDVEQASNGRFGADPMTAIRQWDAFLPWAQGVRGAGNEPVLHEVDLCPPVPRPSKVFGIGMNYREHAREAGLDIPSSPVVFTKFPNCLSGARADVPLLSDFVDWEVELVAVIGRRGRRIAANAAMEHVAGYSVGQDLSDRKMQFADRPPQFSMGKSADGYGPVGPALVSLDTFANPNDLAIACSISGEPVQSARTSDMIFSLAELIVFLSSVCTLEPGDLIFTGTPAGVGSTRDPRRYLKVGEVIESTIEGVGTLVNRCVAG